ncbi:MAG TPA: thioredoxin-dependent thiol peroxidase [Candidatus Limnocylindria bacterium]|nr:thioredoxin-dependent thiol peroxidase [Candidatus Limnocylindria bacterium]
METRAEPRRIQAGEPAPAWEMTADDDQTVSSQSLLGERYVLYFYPKDDTPGCTTQACSLRDNFNRVTSTGISVFGVSPDSVKSHQKFRAKYDLPYRLLSDTDHVTAEAFGVWILKNRYGHEYHGNERTTFIIGADGVVEHVLPAVKPEGHVDLLLEALAA